MGPKVELMLVINSLTCFPEITDQCPKKQEMGPKVELMLLP